MDEPGHEQTFARAWTGLGGQGDASVVWRALARRYAEPHRRYHTLDHIGFGLGALASVPLVHRDAVVVAWCFHDAVYDPARSDNEAKSAAWAAEVLRGGGVAEREVQRIGAMILATAAHEPSEDADTAMLLDVDLAILGADPAMYAAFERAVRAEYAMVPDALWRVGRRAVLQGFLERRPLFQSAAFAHLDAPARRNLAGAVAALS